MPNPKTTRRTQSLRTLKIRQKDRVLEIYQEADGGAWIAIIVGLSAVTGFTVTAAQALRVARVLSEPRRRKAGGK